MFYLQFELGVAKADCGHKALKLDDGARPQWSSSGEKEHQDKGSGGVQDGAELLSQQPTRPSPAARARTRLGTRAMVLPKIPQTSPRWADAGESRTWYTDRNDT